MNCKLCNGYIKEGYDNYLSVAVAFRTGRKNYNICPACVEKAVRKVKTMGFFGRMVRGQMPADLWEFIEQNAPPLIKSRKSKALRTNE